MTRPQEPRDDLLAFYRHPRSQWMSLRTTSQIEQCKGESRKIVGGKDMPKVAETLNQAA